ncbi:hypothetical protein TWF694_005108 [Orbilia ellipsospora]|uniref:N-acetyltransferase domain-containing protein n=1 Tax=Orbilia ellipsospora TaxID=2528407 RepID=A0AAV9WVP7_9PEZI
MRLTEPQIHDPSDPLILYDAYSISQIVVSTFDPAVSELTYLQHGPSSQPFLEMQVKGWTKLLSDEIATNAPSNRSEDSDVPKEGERRTHWRFVIRDMDLEVALPEWEGDLFVNGGMKDTEREEVKEKLKGRGRVVAFSEWYRKGEDWYVRQVEAEKKAALLSEKREAERKKEGKPEPVRGGNAELRKVFEEKIMGMRKRLAEGKAHYMCGNLYTIPSHYRQGAGKKLTMVGTQLADEEGIICYLDASPLGYPVYLKCGFEEVDHVEIDKGLYGGKGIHKHTGMIRQPI